MTLDPLDIALEATVRGELPDPAALRAHFAPAPARMPDILVQLPTIASYDALLAIHGATA